MEEIIIDEVYELEPAESTFNTKGLLIGGGIALALGAGYLLVKKVIVPAYKNYKAQKAVEAQYEPVAPIYDEDDAE